MPDNRPRRIVRTPSGAVVPRIVGAATELLARDGDLTVREVADMAGVAPMSVYNHFGDKQGLVDAVVEGCFKQVDNALSSITIADPRERLDAAGWTFRELGLASPKLFQLMYSQVYELPAPKASEASAPSAFDAIVDVVRYCQLGGVIREGDPRSIASNIWACVWGAVSLEILISGTPNPTPGPKINYAELLDMIMRGVEPD